MLLNYISTRNLRGDAFGGLTAAVVALPMALAFGVASGAGAAAGCTTIGHFFQGKLAEIRGILCETW